MTTTPLSARFAAQMGHLLGPEFPTGIALAVSGGGDSMAMLALAHEWARVMGVGLSVVTVDHGLRAESATEAQMVAQECQALGHPHTTLRWQWDGQGNLQDAARRARLDLIAGWLGDLNHVLFAHTQDDVAETLLMRLLRGSGVEGLSAIEARQWVSARWPDAAGLPVAGQGFWQIRPLLDVSRAELRHYADTLKLPYVDDPSNEDPRFDRARLRQVMSALGLEPDGLAATAHRMTRARRALQARAQAVAAEIATEGRANGQATGELLFDRDGFAAIERDTQMRLLAAALKWIAQADYRPRAAALDDLLDRVLAGGGGTLQGCRVVTDQGQIRIAREFRAVAELCVKAAPSVWDTRWRVLSLPGGTALRALSEDGWRQVPERPGDAPPFATALALPALFAGEKLLHCPQLGVSDGQTHIEFAPYPPSFAESLISH